LANAQNIEREIILRTKISSQKAIAILYCAQRPQNTRTTYRYRLKSNRNDMFGRIAQL